MKCLYTGVMAGVPEDEIKVDVTLGHVGRHCILHALTVIEAAISQVCSSLCLSLYVLTLVCVLTVLHVLYVCCVLVHIICTYVHACVSTLHNVINSSLQWAHSLDT